ncbi:MAG: hypothetical protein UW24_C0008G0008 [Parcubacteria group bacterium GW2011_GWA2_44_12]|nr:MAG: hypothetical protein UW24_C0008G0008 [Parcubacteria group bacterium GW2011_GWA2_44_12]
MTQLITITSQGQISIPSKVRKLFGLDKMNKLLLRVQNNKIILEPAPDIMELEGIFKKYAITDKSTEEVMKLEKDAMGKAFADTYKKKHTL